MEESHRHASLLSVITNRAEQEVRDFMLTEPLINTNTIQHMNLDHIKKYLRYFKDKMGFSNIVLSGNKGACVIQLKATIMSYRASISLGVSPVDEERQQQQQLVVQRQKEMQRLHDQGLKQRMQVAQHGQIQRIQQSAIKTQEHAKGQAPMNHAIVEQNRLKKLEINTHRKAQVYGELMTTGISALEALEGIRGATTEELEDIDMLIYKIALRKSDEVGSSSSGSGSGSDDEDDDADDQNGDDEERNERRAEKERRRSERKEMKEAIERRQKEDEELQEQENKDMDMAILNSEGEREAIANRKKRRISDIMNSCSSTLGDADEFKNSILAGIVGNHHLRMPKNGKGAMSNAKDARVVLIMSKLSIEMHPSESEVITDAIRFLDLQCCQVVSTYSTLAAASKSSSSSSSFIASSSSVSSSSSPSSRQDSGVKYEPHCSRDIDALNSFKRKSDYYECCCPERVKLLRSRLTQLLLLEKDAVKYFGDSCISYFLLLSRCIDKDNHRDNFSAAISTLNSCIAEKPTSTSHNSDSDGKVGNSKFRIEDQSTNLIALSAFISHLEMECKKLEKALYSLPADGNIIPRIFRDAEPPDGGGSAYSIEEDGFEIM